MSCRKTAPLEALAASIRADGGTATPIACDARDEDAVQAVYDRIEAEYSEADELPDEIDERLGEIEQALGAF